MTIAAHKFTFKSLRSDAPFEDQVALTGHSPWMDEGGKVRGAKGDDPNPTRLLKWVLVPLCLIGFLVFAILGTVAVVTTIHDQDDTAALIGGRLRPRPPPKTPFPPR